MSFTLSHTLSSPSNGFSEIQQDAFGRPGQLIHQRVLFVPSVRPRRHFGGKNECSVVNLQFFVIEHLALMVSFQTKCGTKCMTKCPDRGDLCASRCRSKLAPQFLI